MKWWQTGAFLSAGASGVEGDTPEKSRSTVGLCDTMTDRREGGKYLLWNGRTLWTTFSCYTTTVIILTQHLVTPECLLWESSLLAWPHACVLAETLDISCVSSSDPAAWSRNAEESRHGSLWPPKRRKRCDWADERRMIDGCKQSNSVALLCSKRTNIWQGGMMCVPSAPRFSHVAVLWTHRRHRAGDGRQRCQRTLHRWCDDRPTGSTSSWKGGKWPNISAVETCMKWLGFRVNTQSNSSWVTCFRRSVPTFHFASQ